MTDSPVTAAADLSLSTLITGASFPVQLVMAILLIVSLISWWYIFIKVMMIGRAEKEANEFSENELIPRKALQAFVSTKPFTKVNIQQFAQSLGIAPGILVGQLQHKQLLPRTQCNELKQRFQWAHGS